MDVAHLMKQRVIKLSTKYLTGEKLDALIEVLLKSTVLEKLHLLYCNINLADGKFTNALAENKSLRVLDLIGNKIGVEGAKRLANALKVNSSLVTLHLGGQ